jgi:hypothetical protein
MLLGVLFDLAALFLRVHNAVRHVVLERGSSEQLSEGI